MVRNILFKYGRDLFCDEEAEAIYRDSINLWLSEIAGELNNENVIVEYRIVAGGPNRVTFKNISPQLHKRAIEELSRFGL